MPPLLPLPRPICSRLLGVCRRGARTSAKPSSTPPNGRDLSRDLRKAIKEGVESFKARHGYPPHLAVVTVGTRPPAEARRKQLFADEDGSWFDKVSATKAVGMRFTPVPLPADVPLETVISTLRRLGRRRDVHGIMLELPLPPHLYEYRREIWASIDPRKDVDGMSPANCARLFDMAAGVPDDPHDDHGHANRLDVITPLPRNMPTTPLGVLEYLDAYGLAVRDDKHVLVIGRSKLVGLPIASLLLHRHATVTVAHSRTKPELLKDLCRRADVVVVAAGVPGLVKPDWVKRGTIVVNVGTTFNELNEVLLTDTEEAVQRMAGVMVTPTPRRLSNGALTPSGVGPLTLPFVLHSTLVNAVAQAYDDEEKAALESVRGCQKSTPPLSDKEVEEAMSKGGLRAKGWELATCAETKVPILRKTVEVRDFEEALAFCTDIKDLAEDMNHHPSLHITHYRRVTIELSSHVVGKLTHFDLELAAEIDGLEYNPPE